MSERNDLLQKLVSHYEDRARTVDELARRYGELSSIDRNMLRAQALAFREAAAYASRQKD